MRREARAMGHGAPGVLMAPRPTAGRPPLTLRRPARVPLGRAPVVSRVVPIQTPFVDDPGEVVEAEPVREELLDTGRPIGRESLLLQNHSEEPDRVLIAPGVGLVLEPAPRPALPLGLGRQAGWPLRHCGEPRAVGDRVDPAHPDDRLGRVTKEGIVREGRGRVACRLEEGRILRVGHRGDAHLEPVHPDPMARSRIGEPSLPSHPELACRNRDQGRPSHAGEYTMRGGAIMAPWNSRIGWPGSAPSRRSRYWARPWT